MFDALVHEAAARYGLKDKGQVVLTELVKGVFQKHEKGLQGVLDHAAHAHLGAVVHTWVGRHGLPLQINSTQFDNLLGHGFATEVAHHTHLPRQSVASALAFMLPRIVRHVTHDGQVPVGVPAAIAALIPGAAAAATATAAGAAGGAAAAAAGAATAAAGAVAAAASAHRPPPLSSTPPSPPAAPSRGGFPWWILAVIAALLVGWCALRKPAPAPQPPAEAPTPVPATATPAPTEAPTASPAPAPTPEASPTPAPTPAPSEAPTPTPAKSSADEPPAGDKMKAAFADTTAAKDAAAPAPAEAKAALASALAHLELEFPTGSATLSPASLTRVRKAAEAIRQAGNVRIDIGGHTDDVGQPESNLALSQRRADAVLEALVAAGVAKDRISAKGFGSTMPKVPNDTPAHRLENRRIELNVSG